MEPLVSIVILNFNGANYLKTFLPSVLATTYQNKEVVVADNGSKDNSLEILAKYFPTVKVIKNPTNEGFAGGYNWALKQVQADYYILLNSDVQVDANWVGPMVQLMESNPTIGACQPKILAQKDPSSFEYAGACGGWIDALGYPFSRGRVFDVCEQDKGQYDSAEPIFWASGAAMMIRSKLFHDLGGFDASFFAHQEEIDLCWRLQRRGYQIYACPKSIVWHVGGSNLPKGNSQKTFLNYRNNLWMLAKNLPLSTLCWVLPVRFALDALAAYKALFSGDLGYWWAVAKSHFALIKKLFSSIGDASNKDPKTNKLSGRYNGSILLDYYIKGKKTFLEITGTNA